MRKGQHCGNCRNLDAFYFKAYCEFLRTDYGYCYQTRSVQAKENYCDCWQRKLPKKRSVKEVLKEMEDAITDIAVLRQIFSEEKEEDE